MRILLVLGAGATLAQAQYLRSRGIGSGKMPPLDSTFFERVSELSVHVDDELRDYGTSVLGFDPFQPGGSSPGMESFFKDVFYDFTNSRKKSSSAARRYGTLVVTYREVLLQTTDWVCDNANDGPVTDLLSSAAQAADHVDIITFNHDLLIENILADLDIARGRWCLRHGYGHFGRNREFTAQTGRLMFSDERTCSHPRPIRIYKLHGSLNWYVDSESPVPDAGVLRGERGTDQRVHVTRRRRVPRNLHRKKADHSWPVVIPPVYAKQPFISNFMAQVWQDARGAIGACDRIVFYGYSLPLLDIEAEKEFQRAMARNARLAAVDVINPAPLAASRYADAFPRQSVRWAGSLERFFTTSPFA
jgi:hypothetical protein